MQPPCRADEKENTMIQRNAAPLAPGALLHLCMYDGATESSRHCLPIEKLFDRPGRKTVGAIAGLRS